MCIYKLYMSILKCSKSEWIAWNNFFTIFDKTIHAGVCRKLYANEEIK